MAEPRISPSIPISARILQEIQQEAAEETAMQVESEEDLQQFFELSLYNPMLMAQRFKRLDEHKTAEKEKLETVKAEEDAQILDIEKVEESATRFQQKNYELSSKTLLILRSRLLASDSAEDILEKVLDVYPDQALADEALDFLIETADPRLLDKIKKAKDLLNERYEREIKAGRNMGIHAREFSKEGLGSPTTLRDMYRDITGNPREPLKLFEELSDRFRFEKLKSVITFLLHSLGSDLKAKGSSIPHAELKRLIDETRSLQGILGVFRYFQSRMRLIGALFASSDLIMPPKLDFEALAKLFIKMLAERYMNPEKILQTARYLGIDEEVAAQIIIYTQMQGAIRQVAPRYYRNRQHRDELQKAFIDTLDKLEDALEEEEEKK